MGLLSGLPYDHVVMETLSVYCHGTLSVYCHGDPVGVGGVACLQALVRQSTTCRQPRRRFVGTVGTSETTVPSTLYIVSREPLGSTMRHTHTH